MSNDIQEDLFPLFPPNDVVCKDCSKRRLGIVGFKNIYCKEYEKGKPYEILFEHADCKYYSKH